MDRTNQTEVELTNRSLQTAEYHHLYGDRSADHNLGTGSRGAGLTLPSRHFANSIRVDVAAFLNQPLKCGFGIDLGGKGADRDRPTTVGMPSLNRKASEFVRAHGVSTAFLQFLATSTHDKNELVVDVGTYGYRFRHDALLGDFVGQADSVGNSSIGMRLCAKSRTYPRSARQL